MGPRIAALTLVASLSVGGLAVGATRAPRPVSVSVVTAPGTTLQVQKALRRRGVHVDRRSGRRLQVVVARASQRARIARIPGVRAVATPPTAYGDAVVSQGVDRTGASALADVAGGGAGLRIAILDLGFGTAVAGLQSRGELPPPNRLLQQSFDPAGGISGTNAYGNPTNHGELVAQTVYDYAPRAQYLLVSYHTPEDFAAAVDWLIGQRVDIVVHSNNFLDGPFDGTSPAARAVDRAAAAGILWFNSAGNYGEKHWAGPWVDDDGDGALDWPGPTPWTFTHQPDEALTFHLSWRNPPGAERSDVDLFLERRRPDGVWEVVAGSTDRQSAGAAPSERINGHRPLQPAVYRIRAQLVSGPPPGGDLTLFSREDDLIGFAGTPAGSIPTPADAAGSISVGAIDWRSNSLVRYSSRGPTADGRTKPDISAPTGTSLATPGGDPRDVGGTSIAAPNAAGAAALALAALRASGLSPTVAEMRSILDADALDLGEPGPDATFGAGRIRVDTDPPSLRPVEPPPRGPFRGPIRVAVEATDAGALATWALVVDGARVRVGRAAREVIGARISPRALADGAHSIGLEVGDAVGNVRRKSWRIVTDNTAPSVAITSVNVGGPVHVTAARKPRRPLHGVSVMLDLSDAVSRALSLRATLTRITGSGHAMRRLTVSTGSALPVAVGRVPVGVYVLRVSVADRAGNVRTLTQGVRVTNR